jgi:hypothetical protein
MRSLLFRLLPLAILAAFWGSPATARAGVPVLITHGETIAHLEDLPDEIKQEIRKELKCEPAVGYAYSYFGIFWCDLWTWNGRYVLFHDKQYWELKPENLRLMLGKSEEELGKPFLYRFPLGLLILAGLLAAWLPCKFLMPSDAERVKKLLADHRYQHAVDLLTPPANEAPAPPPESSPAPEDGEPGTPTPQELRYQAAVEYLVTEGIDRKKAEAHLLLIMQTLSTMPSA